MESDPSTTSAAASLLSATSSSHLYSSQALFALCSWPFSLKLLWAPLVDALFIKRIGRRKSWLLPTQFAAGALMFGGAKFVGEQIGKRGEERKREPKKNQRTKEQSENRPHTPRN